MGEERGARRAAELGVLYAMLALGALSCSEGGGGRTGAAGAVRLPDAAPGGSSGGASSGGSSGADATGTDSATRGDGGSGGGAIRARKCVAAGKGECDNGAECSSEQYCDPCTRRCLTPRKLCQPCTDDVQCDKAEYGSACMVFLSGGSYCGLTCISDVGCPSGSRCAEIPGLTATQKKQCVPKSGSCQAGSGQCSKDSDCPYTMICNSEYEKCLKGCAKDGECPGGKLCSLFRCQDPCKTDADCTKLSAQARCDAGKCRIPGGCLGPADCPDKETYCDPKAHKCRPGCLHDADCKDFTKKCVAGQCEIKGCTANWECAFEQVCDLAGGKCKKAQGKFCAKCDAQDKSAATCGGDPPHKCFSFQDKDGKKLGDFCAIACSDAKVGPCPQGYQCQEVPDKDGKPIGKFCLRQCWQSPYPDEP